MSYEALYEQATKNGCSERLADMLASRQGPCLKTDTAFFQRWHADPLEKVKPQLRKVYAEKAKAAGVSVKGKRYFGSLAAYPGDPRAWVTSRAEAKAVCEERGWGATGMINVKAREAPPVPARGKPAEDIVTERAMQIAASDGVEDKCSRKEWADYKDKAVKSLE